MSPRPYALERGRLHSVRAELCGPCGAIPPSPPPFPTRLEPHEEGHTGPEERQALAAAGANLVALLERLERQARRRAEAPRRLGDGSRALPRSLPHVLDV